MKHRLLLLILCATSALTTYGMWHKHCIISTAPEKASSLEAQAAQAGQQEYKQQVAAAVETKRQSADIAAGVHQIHDGLYVGQVNDTFYVAMERITPENIDMWTGYAKLQVTAGSRIKSKYLPSNVGSALFTQVLTEYQSGKIASQNELWVAYASNAPITKQAELKTCLNAENPDIEMFVTVITSPDALINSHMGISRTVEAAQRMEISTKNRAPDQSVHLHSFAAKVMKMRDSKKVYMLTAPVKVMRDILIKKMPADSVFVGDDLYQKKLVAAEKDRRSLLRVYDLEKEENETTQAQEDRLTKSANAKYDFYNIKEKIALLKTNPPRISRIKDRKKQSFTFQKPDGSTLVTFGQSTPTYQWLFTKSYDYNDLNLPYVLVDLDKLAAATKLQDS